MSISTPHPPHRERTRMLSQRKSILNHGNEQATWETITPKPSSSSISFSRGKKVLNTCRLKQIALDTQSVSGSTVLS